MRCSNNQFQAGNSFHIYNHAIGNENLFRDKSDYILLLQRLKKSLEKTKASIFAYCLMPDHFHFLIRQESEEPVYKLFNSLFSSYVQLVNRKYNRKGRMFQSPLQHIMVDSDQYLLYLCQYIHYNPVKAGLVNDAKDWLYSNYLEWIGKRNGVLFNPELRDSYFNSPDDYIESIKEHEKYLEDLPFLRLVFQMEDIIRASMNFFNYSKTRSTFAF